MSTKLVTCRCALESVSEGCKTEMRGLTDVVGITAISLVLPANSNSRDDSNTRLGLKVCPRPFFSPDLHHSQAHCEAKANLFSLLHLQPSRDKPREACKHEIHNDVVNCTPLVSSSTSRCPWSLTVATLLEVISELGIQAEVESIPVVVRRLSTDFSPLEEDLDDHVGVHAGNTEPKDPFLPAVTHS